MNASNAIKPLAKSAPSAIGLLLWAGAAATAAHWGAERMASPTPASAPASAARPDPADGASVAKALGARDKSKEEPKADAPPVDASIALMGIAVGRDGRGIALISGKDSPALPYREGAKLPNGALLKSVLADRIVVSSQGVESEALAPKLPNLLPMALPPLPGGMALPPGISGVGMPGAGMGGSPISAVARVIAPPPPAPSYEPERQGMPPGMQEDPNMQSGHPMPASTESGAPAP